MSVSIVIVIILSTFLMRLIAPAYSRALQGSPNDNTAETRSGCISYNRSCLRCIGDIVLFGLHLLDIGQPQLARRQELRNIRVLHGLLIACSLLGTLLLLINVIINYSLISKSFRLLIMG